MSADDAFTLAVGLAGLAAVAAVVSSRLSTLIRVPSPALFLIAAVAASSFFPVLETVPRVLDEHVVSVALVFILFDGGMHIGWSRFRNSLGPITWLGVAGTAVTAAGVALAGHLLLELPWQQSLLLGAALAPTDPAVVFSVLGKREISGRSGTILEGESGANDPVGIALMVSLLAATGAGLDAVTQGLLTFVLQLLIGTAVGVLGGLTLRWALQRLALPNEALHSIWTLAFAVVLYAVGTLLHGSGFLAVFLAGILIGDVRAPFKREIDRFSSGFSNLAEIVVFTLLGLSTDVAAVVRPDVLLPGLLIAALLILVVRPLFVGALSIPCACGGVSAHSCCGRDSRGPCRSCSDSRSSPRAWHTRIGCSASSSSWWCARWCCRAVSSRSSPGASTSRCGCASRSPSRSACV